MWQRFKRAMRSFAGFFVSSIEDPELILEQNVRDLNDQVPKMNESIAMVRANVTLLEKENSKYNQDIRELTAGAPGAEDRVTLKSGESRLIVERGRIARVVAPNRVTSGASTSAAS